MNFRRRANLLKTKWLWLLAMADLFFALGSSNRSLAQTKAGPRSPFFPGANIAEWIFGPLRERVIVGLKHGELRGGVKPAVAADLLYGRCITGVLPLEYVPRSALG